MKIFTLFFKFNEYYSNKIIQTYDVAVWRSTVIYTERNNLVILIKITVKSTKALLKFQNINIVNFGCVRKLNSS